MIITAPGMADIFTGFKTTYDVGFEGAPSTDKTIAMDVQSSAREEKYPFMNAIPQLREWLGDRVIRNLEAHGFTIVNQDFESTVSVGRNDIEDDRYGVFSPLFMMMGQNAKQHPDKIVYDLWNKGTSTLCYDGQNFFDTDHPIEIGGHDVSFSNYQPGSGPTWFLVDSSRPIKPMVFQTRRPYVFTSVVRPDDHRVFMNREFIYGVDARVAAGFALWQLAYASNAPLTHDNYAAARAAMIGIPKDNGEKMGVVPTHLIVPATLESAARQVVRSETRIITIDTGSPAVPQSVAISNEWAGTAEMIMTPWL